MRHNARQSDNNKIFISFAPGEKYTEISKCVFALAFIIYVTFIHVHQHIASRYLAVNIVF